MVPCRDTEMMGYGFANIGEGRANADQPGPDTGTKGHDRHPLAGMVAAAPGRIAAVIGGQKRDIAGPHAAMHVGQPPVEGFQRCRIAGHVAAMAVIHVEIDEIGEHQVARCRLFDCLQRFFHDGMVAGGLDDTGDALMGENVADLADRMHPVTRLHHPVEQRRFRRKHGKIAPVACALEGGTGLADEGTRNDPSDIEGIDDPPHRLAERNQPVEAEMGFMRGYLEDAVGGRIADRLAGPYMLFAILRDDLGAGRVAIAENAGQGTCGTDGLDQIRAEGIALLGKITPVEIDRGARNFPMAGGRILAARGFGGRAMQAEDAWRDRHAGGIFATRKPCCLQQAESRHVGEFQRTAAQIGPVARPGGTEFGDMAERVGPAITVTIGIRCATNAKGIQYEEKCTRHQAPVARTEAERPPSVRPANALA